MNDIGFYYKHKMLYAWFFAMHTRIDILLCGEDEPRLRQTVALISKELGRLEKTASYFDPSSELSRVNRSAAREPIAVSDDLYQMIVWCERLHRRTDGYFDITVKSEDYSRQSFQQLEIKDHTIFFRREGLRLDLSGFLKGYALEQIRQIVDSESITDALINLGNSSILALGNHTNGKPWKISIESKVCVLNNQCLTTSGNEENKPNHIICPDTGQYIERQETLSVVTENGIEGEALSTALFAAPKDKRSELVQKFNAQYIN